MSATTTSTTIKLGKNTNVHIVVDRREENPYQMDMFADYKENWCREMVELALRMPHRFYFSELRYMAAHEPPNANWWGSTLVQRMKKFGFRQTGNYRRHTRQSRKGGIDMEWMRISAEKEVEKV